MLVTWNCQVTEFPISKKLSSQRKKERAEHCLLRQSVQRVDGEKDQNGHHVYHGNLLKAFHKPWNHLKGILQMITTRLRVVHPWMILLRIL